MTTDKPKASLTTGDILGLIMLFLVFGYFLANLINWIS